MVRAPLPLTMRSTLMRDFALKRICKYLFVHPLLSFKLVGQNGEPWHFDPWNRHALDTHQNQNHLLAYLTQNHPIHWHYGALSNLLQVLWHNTTEQSFRETTLLCIADAIQLCSPFKVAPFLIPSTGALHHLTLQILTSFLPWGKLL